MRLAGDEECQPGAFDAPPVHPTHPETLGNRGERRADFLWRNIHPVEFELDPLQEDPLLLVGVLVGVEDVRPLAEQEVGHGSDQTTTVRAGEQQDAGAERFAHSWA